MSTQTISFYSNLLNKNMNVSIYVPEGYFDKKLPVLYFLHGRSGSEQLLSYLQLDKISEKMIKNNQITPMIIVCPNMDNSRGINSSNEYKEVKGKYGIVNKGLYEDYLINEVIPLIDKKFNTISDRQGRFIGGISSGGYTALHNCFRHQDMFSKVGGHMPAMDLHYEDEDECYFENEKMWNKYDPMTIVKNNQISDDIKVWIDDGDEDEGHFYDSCKVLEKLLKEKNISVQNYVFQGHHNGEYIVSNLEKYLKFYGNN